MKSLISVIIPVFNAERHLENAILSVLNQTYEDFEIIAVNDGSTDSSLEILNRIDDSRIRVIDKPNTGVSDSRNIGILNACGDYIAFLDSDDIYSPHYLERLIDVVEKTKSDMVVCNYEAFKGKIKFVNKITNPVHIEYSQQLIQKGVLTSVWTKLISKRLILDNDIKFSNELSYGEDLFFCWKCFLVSERLYYLDEVLYGYRMSGIGATSKHHLNLFNKYKKSFNELKRFGELKNKNDESSMNFFFTTRIPTFVRMIIWENSSFQEKSRRLNDILDDETIVKTFQSWDVFTDKLSPKSINYYKQCRNKRIRTILIKAYISHYVEIIKNIVKSKL